MFPRPYRMIFTNGCFDILHAGHLHLLKTAKSLSGRLVVGINSDASVSALKGPTRPIQNQEARRLQLSLLPWVDQVEIFDEPTPLELIRALEPDVIVKGGDYQAHQVVGADLAKVVIIVPTLEGFSTSSLVARINAGQT